MAGGNRSGVGAKRSSAAAGHEQRGGGSGARRQRGGEGASGLAPRCWLGWKRSRRQGGCVLDGCGWRTSLGVRGVGSRATGNGAEWNVRNCPRFVALVYHMSAHSVKFTPIVLWAEQYLGAGSRCLRWRRLGYASEVRPQLSMASPPHLSTAQPHHRAFVIDVHNCPPTSSTVPWCDHTSGGPTRATNPGSVAWRFR